MQPLLLRTGIANRTGTPPPPSLTPQVQLPVAKGQPQATVMLRVGIHSGRVMSGVVGRIRRRYCLFGDTVRRGGGRGGARGGRGCAVGVGVGGDGSMGRGGLFFYPHTHPYHLSWCTHPYHLSCRCTHPYHL